MRTRGTGTLGRRIGALPRRYLAGKREEVMLVYPTRDAI
jgi:hypothetical protein